MSLQIGKKKTNATKFSLDSCGARALVVIPVVLLFLRPAGSTSFAGSATWNAAPDIGDWGTAVNWMPRTVPNSPLDPATFATSNITGVSLSSLIEVNSIVFNSGASAFTITDNSFAFTISGVGINNNSTATQTFVAGVDAVGGAATLIFSNSATTGTATVVTSAPTQSDGQGKALLDRGKRRGISRGPESAGGRQ